VRAPEKCPTCQRTESVSRLWQAISSAWSYLRHVSSPPARGAWIETTSPSRTRLRGAWIETCPNRSKIGLWAWIETAGRRSRAARARRRPPRGRGLKPAQVPVAQRVTWRGLKLEAARAVVAARAWIETNIRPTSSRVGAWIETSSAMAGSGSRGRGLKRRIDPVEPHALDVD
jgi:hypothetical protein